MEVLHPAGHASRANLCSPILERDPALCTAPSCQEQHRSQETPAQDRQLEAAAPQYTSVPVPSCGGIAIKRTTQIYHLLLI